jgi:hypothetical protein
MLLQLSSPKAESNKIQKKHKHRKQQQQMHEYVTILGPIATYLSPVPNHH